MRSAESPTTTPIGTGACNAGKRSHLERHGPRSHQAGGDQRAHPGQRDLGERELTGVAGDHDERQEDDADGGGGRKRVDPAARSRMATSSAPTVSSTAQDGRTMPVPSSGGVSMASPAPAARGRARPGPR